MFYPMLDTAHLDGWSTVKWTTVLLQNLITHSRTLSAIYDTQMKPYEELTNINGEKENPHIKSSTFDAEVKIPSPYKSTFHRDILLKQKNNPYSLRNIQPLDLRL